MVAGKIVADPVAVGVELVGVGNVGAIVGAHAHVALGLLTGEVVLRFACPDAVTVRVEIVGKRALGDDLAGDDARWPLWEPRCRAP